MSDPKKANSLKALRASKSAGADAVTRSDTYKVDPRIIKIEDGFNVRSAFAPDYWERESVKEFVSSIARAYKLGVFVHPITVRVRDSAVYVVDGEHRLRGCLQAIAEGADIKRITVSEVASDPAANLIVVATSSESQSLTPLSRAVLYQRMATWGWRDAEIARELGKTAEHVRQTRLMLTMPEELKVMVQQDKVSATYAYELYTKHGDRAVALVRDAAADSRTRVSRKVVQREPRLKKETVSAMHRSVAAIADRLERTDAGEYRVVLSAQEAEELLALREVLQPPSPAGAGESGEHQEPLFPG